MRAATRAVSKGMERRQQREAAVLLLVALFRRFQSHARNGRRQGPSPHESRAARAQRSQGQTRYFERRFSHLAGQGTESSAARRKVFCDRRTAKGILLDPRGE